jgi:hypothetical protein
MIKSRYWDLFDVTHDVWRETKYRDFAGLSEPDNVIAKVRDISMPLSDAQRDIVLNIAYEYVDEGTGEMPSEDLLYMIAHTVIELTTCPYWMRTGIVW